MAKFEIGQIMPVTRGEWNAETTYKICDVVRYEGTSYWVRKDGIRGIPPAGETDENYQMLVKDYIDTRYADADVGVIAEYAGENPRKNGFVQKVFDAAYGRGTLFSTPEELKSAAEHGNCVVLTPFASDGGGRYPNEINPGDRIVFAAVSFQNGANKDFAAVLVTPSLTALWTVAHDSAGTETVAREEEFKFRGAKREANVSFAFNDDYYGDFGSGAQEEGLMAIVTAELPESSLYILLPGMTYGGNEEDKTFKDAEIVVHHHSFSVTEEYGRRTPYLSMTLLAHNRDVKGKQIFAKVFAL